MTYQGTISYNKTIAKKHDIGILAGYEAVRYMYRYTTTGREGGGDQRPLGRCSAHSRPTV